MQFGLFHINFWKIESDKIRLVVFVETSTACGAHFVTRFFNWFGIFFVENKAKIFMIILQFHKSNTRQINSFPEIKSKYFLTIVLGRVSK